MNLYSRKQVWKLILSVIALIIVTLSLWYSSELADDIAKEEEKKVRLWVEAIQKRETLVRYTNDLFKKIREEERKKVELWAEATKELANANNLNDYTFVLKVVADNTSVPVILADDEGNIISHRNLEKEQSKDQQSLLEQMNLMAATREPIEINIYADRKNYLYYQDSKLFAELKRVLDDLIETFISEVVINSASVPVIFTDKTKENIIAFGNLDSVQIGNNNFLKTTLLEMASQNEPIAIDLGDGNTNHIFYKNSLLYTQLRYYPIIQFGIIGLFILLGYWLFSTARKSEQNQVWVGMAKETAHQLGTPLSSLMAWLELMKQQNVDKIMIKELNKDITRLETITERFSKIGSAPSLTSHDVVEVLRPAVEYMQSRSSDKLNFNIQSSNEQIQAKLNIPLFEWVIENLLKNAIDAMNGIGTIDLEVIDQVQVVYVDITDSGKGIPSSKQKTIFEPGYTTKPRGWGLGLSLTKRIIENYHSGKIFVKRSDPDRGTTFRIVLNK